MSDSLWPHGLWPPRLLRSWDFPGKNTAISFSRGSSQLRDQTWVSCTVVSLFTVWAVREAPNLTGVRENIRVVLEGEQSVGNGNTVCVLGQDRGGNSFPLTSSHFYLYFNRYIRKKYKMLLSSWFTKEKNPLKFGMNNPATHQMLYLLLNTLLLLLGCPVTSDSLWPHRRQHTTLSCPSPSPGVCSHSCPLSWWCHPTISFSVTPFSSGPQSFPASGSFPMSQLFASVQYTGAISKTTEWSRFVFKANHSRSL